MKKVISDSPAWNEAIDGKLNKLKVNEIELTQPVEIYRNGGVNIPKREKAAEERGIEADEIHTVLSAIDPRIYWSGEKWKVNIF